MNLVYGEVIAIFMHNGVRMGRIRINGVLRNAPLMLLPEAREGDDVLLCDGVPIRTARTDNKEEPSDVSGNPRKSP